MTARLAIGLVAVASSLVAPVVVGCSHHGDADVPVDGAATDAGLEDTSVEAGPPSLVTLSVSGAAGDLVPAFSSKIHDYYVRCSGTAMLTVSMTASPGASTMLLQPSSSPSAPSQTLSVSTAENQPIVAVASDGSGATTQYWVRCLPHDFPQMALTMYADAGAPSGGYYLLGNAVLSVGEGGYAMAVDGNGVPVWYHRVGDGLAVTDVDNVVGGAITFITTSFFALGSFEIDRLSPLTRTVVAPKGYTTDEHELRVLPNGHYLVFSYVLKSGVDLTGLAITKAFDAGALELGPNSTIQDCAIVEFDDTGKVFSTWSASDHFDPVATSTYPQTGFGPDTTLPDGGPTYDVYHCNSIDVDPANGNLLVSARGMDSIFYIDRPTGKVLWKMGGANSSVDKATYVSVADPFFRQHDARLLGGWSPTCRGGTGQVSVFDDETGNAGPARAVIYDVVVGGAADGGCGDAGAAGGSPGHATVAWQYPGADVSGGGGSVRVSPDGSRVIGWGIGIPVFTEVDVHGNKLLELALPTGDVSYRTVKVPLSTFDLGVLRSTAGL